MGAIVLNAETFSLAAIREAVNTASYPHVRGIINQINSKISDEVSRESKAELYYLLGKCYLIDRRLIYNTIYLARSVHSGYAHSPTASRIALYVPRYDRAISCFTRSLKIKADSSDVYLQLATTLERVDRIQEAFEAYIAAYRLNRQQSILTMILRLYETDTTITYKPLNEREISEISSSPSLSSLIAMLQSKYVYQREQAIRGICDFIDLHSTLGIAERREIETNLSKLVGRKFCGITIYGTGDPDIRIRSYASRVIGVLSMKEKETME